jgi:hypothetical protein
MGEILYFGNLRSDLPVWSRTAGNLAMQKNGSFEHVVTFTQGCVLANEEVNTLDEIARRINAVRCSASCDVNIEIVGFALDTSDDKIAKEKALTRANAVMGELALRGVSTRGISMRASEVASLKRSAVVRVSVEEKSDLAA